MPTTEILKEPSRFFRAPIARGVVGKIDREGGDYKSGLIRGAAVLTRGIARGHGEWADETLLKQTETAINREPTGTKSRFAHPSLSGDGLGKALGRYKDATIDGNIVRADLHLFETAHKTPSGDLARYVMDLADEDPRAFGTSIAFDADREAMEAFRSENTREGRFKSPDPENTKNLPHVRLATLVAVDAVDSPAANPGGLFHVGDEVAFWADSMLAYALGIIEDEPDDGLFGVAPPRVRRQVQEYLAREGWELHRIVKPSHLQALDGLRARMILGKLSKEELREGVKKIN